MTSMAAPGDEANIGGRAITGVDGPSGWLRSRTVTRPAARSAMSVVSVVMDVARFGFAYSIAVSRPSLFLACALAAAGAAGMAQPPRRSTPRTDAAHTWGYGGGPAQTRHSPL